MLKTNYDSGFYFLAMASFCTSCSVLLTDELIRRLLVITDACLAMLPRCELIFNVHVENSIDVA